MAVQKGIKWLNSPSFVPMAGVGSDDDADEVRAAFEPRTIKDLCAQADLHISQILLFCPHCWRPLTHYDKVLQDISDIKLTWIRGLPYGICQHCLKLKCKVDFLLHYERTLTALDVERETGESIFSIEIRCLKCCRRLTRLEKQASVVSLEAFQVVNGGLRICCSICRVF
uniref:Protein E6 n=1 Tax=Mops bat papillomavirus TaxID=3141892 RepID=A0AAU7E383_9PAPI